MRSVTPSRGWISTEVISTGIAGIVFITLFIIVELKVKQPMLDLRLFKEPVFRKMSLISLFSSAGLLGMLFVFPLMYQNVIGYPHWNQALLHSQRPLD